MGPSSVPIFFSVLRRVILSTTDSTLPFAQGYHDSLMVSEVLEQPDRTAAFRKLCTAARRVAHHGDDPIELACTFRRSPHAAVLRCLPVDTAGDPTSVVVAYCFSRVFFLLVLLGALCLVFARVVLFLIALLTIVVDVHSSLLHVLCDLLVLFKVGIANSVKDAAL